MEQTQKQTVLQCVCGRKHEVPVNILVKSKDDLERENTALLVRLNQVKNAVAEAIR